MEEMLKSAKRAGMGYAEHVCGVGGLGKVGRGRVEDWIGSRAQQMDVALLKASVCEGIRCGENRRRIPAKAARLMAEGRELFKRCSTGTSEVGVVGSRALVEEHVA